MNDTFNERLQKVSQLKNSKLCIGLDIDPSRMPDSMNKSLLGIESHLKDIIDSTSDICLAYKLNMAFYEQFGFRGYELMEKLVSYIDGRNITIGASLLPLLHTSYLFGTPSFHIHFLFSFILPQ